MEGNAQQYQIRTMARDLERARGKPFDAAQGKPSSQAPPLPPKRAEVPSSKSAPGLVSPKPASPSLGGRVEAGEERKLQDILAEARVRVAQAPIQKAETPVQKVEAPIRRTLEDILPIEPFDSAQGKPLDTPTPRPEPRVVQGPPQNLPTGEPSLVLSPPEGKTVLPSPVEGKRRTPEEILGLPAKLGPVTSRVERVEPAGPAPQARQGGFRFVLFSGFLAIVIIGLGYGIYWKVSKPEALPPPPPAIKVSEQPLPEALIQTIETETIELSGLNYDNLKPKIDILAETKFLPESLVYIPIRFTTQPASPSQGGKEARYLTLLQIFEVLQIDAPTTLYSHKNFTLYLYSQGTEAQKLCDEAGIVSKSCYGPRIGIAIELPDLDEGTLTKNIAFSIMKEWEKTIVDDLGPLMLSVPQKTSAQFVPGKYKNFDTSFINLPISTTSLDWILTDTHLIIATSKDAARAAVDALK